MRKTMTIGEALSIDVQRASSWALWEAMQVLGQRKLSLRQQSGNSYKLALKSLNAKLDQVLYAADPYLRPWDLYPFGGPE